MAYDSTNKKLYTTDAQGISTSEIAACLGDYRVTARGRDIGLLCTSPKINKWSPAKPFRNASWKFGSKAEKDAARRMANQGLLLPTAANAGVGTSQAAYRRTYLGYLTYLASTEQVPNYTYQQPRGKSYNEPFRLLDFDGYMHRANKPFQTIIMGMEKSDLRNEINRFTQNTLVCRIIKNVDSIAMSDLINDTLSYYYFTAEVYLGTENYPFYSVSPTYTYVASQPITALVNANDYQDIVIPLDSSLDNKYIDIVIGINKFYPDVNNSKDNGKKVPATESKGFIEPWEEGKYPYYMFVQRYYGILDLQHGNGYYIKPAANVFSSFDLNTLDYTYKTTASDKVGISLNLKKASENYYVVGTKNYYLPDNYIKYKFRLVRQTSNGNFAVVGILSNPTMTSDVESAAIYSTGADYQTVYLRFDNFLPNSGDEVAFAILEVSNDDGASWTPLGEVNQGNSGSSVHLYLKRL